MRTALIGLVRISPCRHKFHSGETYCHKGSSRDVPSHDQCDEPHKLPKWEPCARAGTSLTWSPFCPLRVEQPCPVELLAFPRVSSGSERLDRRVHPKGSNVATQNE